MKEVFEINKINLFVCSEEAKSVREKISCPQLGDNYYGMWGGMSLEQRIMLYRMANTIQHLEQLIEEKRIREVLDMGNMCEIGHCPMKKNETEDCKFEDCPYKHSKKPSAEEVVYFFMKKAFEGKKDV